MNHENKNRIIISENVANDLEINTDTIIKINNLDTKLHSIDVYGSNSPLDVIVFKAKRLINNIENNTLEQGLDDLNYFSNFNENVSRVIDIENNDTYRTFNIVNSKLPNFDMNTRVMYIMEYFSKLTPKINENYRNLIEKNAGYIKDLKIIVRTIDAYEEWLNNAYQTYYNFNLAYDDLTKYEQKNLDNDEIKLQRKAFLKKICDINDKLIKLNQSKAKIMRRLPKGLPINIDSMKCYDDFATVTNEIFALQDIILSNRYDFTYEQRIEYIVKLEKCTFILFKSFVESNREYGIPEDFYIYLISQIKILLQNISK